jgi:teichuronic acid biosynthesis glycosyltransferase TuaH
VSSVPEDVEVVVIAHRSASELGDCLAAIGAPERTLVVDNGSDDDGPEIARRAGCQVLETGANLGFARAVDVAMRHTSAPFVLFVNPDATVEPDTANELRAAMSDGVAATAARLRSPDGTQQRSSWPFPSARRSWIEALGLHRLGSSRHDVAAFVVGACMLVRRAAFDEVGGFDERFWLYGEETDFCRRAADRGWTVSVVDAAVCTHVGGASARRSSIAAEQFVRGTDRFILHHQGRAALVSHRLAFLIGSALRWPVLAVVPGRAEQRRTRGVAIRSCVRSLLMHPTTVPTVPDTWHRTVVVCSLERWDDVWRRNQLFVRELVGRADQPTRVLFVEPPVDVVHELRSGRGAGLRADRRARLVSGTPGVAVLRPRKVVPRVLGGWADRSLRRQVRRAVRDLGFSRPVLWINDSTYADLAAESDWPSLYDITDDWLLEQVPRREHRRRVRRETALLHHVDRVVACSEAIATDRRRSRPVAVVTNGVDVEAFTAETARPGDLPAGRVAVYVGTLHRERIDLDLVEACARRIPEVALVFVGPNCLEPADTSRLDRHHNVHLLGSRPYEDVPAYLGHADVCFVPHVVSPFTESLDPIKAYECRASGVPTLATPVAGFRGLAEPIRVSPPSEFPDALAAMVAAPPDRSPDPTVPTWGSRAVEFSEELDAAVRGRAETGS